jgi:hypothetical protein
VAVSGTVDTSGNAVPSAKVSLKSSAGGQTFESLTDTSGKYSFANLAPGDYEVNISAQGFIAKTASVSLAASQNTNWVIESSSGNAVTPSLNDLGFPSEVSQGNAAEQARLDKRSHMLKIHQRLGLITIVPLVATIIASSMAGGRHATAAGRDVHAGMGGEGQLRTHVCGEAEIELIRLAGGAHAQRDVRRSD